MKNYITDLKNKIKERFDNIFEDFFKNQRNIPLKLQNKLKTKLKKKYTQYGIDAYVYKTKNYFNSAQDKIEKL